MDEEVLDKSSVASFNAFMGTMPFDAILEGLTSQFSDYLNITDNTDYVDLFYNQYHESYNYWSNVEGEEQLDDYKDALDDIYTRFITSIATLFEQRLTLTIELIEEEHLYRDELEQIIRMMYKGFILDARDNFKKVISSDIIIRCHLSDIEEAMVAEMLADYTPLIKSVNAEKFLELLGNSELIEGFREGSFSGNFLRKYSPYLYKNDLLSSEIIQITMEKAKTLKALTNDTIKENDNNE